ncbi:DUF1569 domain-containing protein [Leptolyngbyaceae cyanobacterium CCMR0082]|uniref:DUF1569 domain-containing protein n=3 Tax=Adonisia turfae TaxID=2950184 RepID=A0A6M0SDW2_9CYAN|nr:DUF1569 domain-containing protein [Adonisia turfae]NEZ66668.1 DUF1569 domain-containing protein [Adonisia turfae CCMR0082]
MLTISSALETIASLSNRPLHSTGAWQPYAILTHCAQSVECSMVGYPIQQPEIYKATVGKLAFTLFSALGAMQHPLDEPIPGAPELEAHGNLKKALARLKKAYIDFDNYTDSLAPHFTYGDLSKQDYIRAHVMHLNNHLEEIREYSA